MTTRKTRSRKKVTKESGKGSIKDLRKLQKKKAGKGKTKQQNARKGRGRSKGRGRGKAAKSKNKKTSSKKKKQVLLSPEKQLQQKREEEKLRKMEETKQFARKAKLLKLNEEKHIEIEKFYFNQMSQVGGLNINPGQGQGQGQDLYQFQVANESKNDDHDHDHDNLDTPTSLDHYSQSSLDFFMEDTWGDETFEEKAERERLYKQQHSHKLTPFLEVLLEHETNKTNLQKLLCEKQILDAENNPIPLENLITRDTFDWTEQDYGELNFDDWELDDQEVGKLFKQFTRSVIAPLVECYVNGQLPWDPLLPDERVYIKSSSVSEQGSAASDSDASQRENQEQEQEQDDQDQDQELKHDTEHSSEQDYSQLSVKQQIRKTKKKTKQLKKQQQLELEQQEKQSEQAEDDDDEDYDDDDGEEEEEEDDDEQDEDDGVSEQGSVRPSEYSYSVRDSTLDSDDDEDDDDESDLSTDEEYLSDDEVEYDEAHDFSSESEDDDDEDSDSDSDDDDDELDDEDEDDDDFDDYEDEDELDEEDAKQEELEEGSYPWGTKILSGEPALCRIATVFKDSRLQSHDIPTLWRRVFHHFKGDPISLPRNAAELSDKSYKKTKFGAEGFKLDIEIMNTSYDCDQLLQSLPDKIGDQMVHPEKNVLDMEEIYESREPAVVRRREQNKPLKEQLEPYITKFELEPVPENLTTFNEPKFVAKFANMEKYCDLSKINFALEDAGDSEDRDPRDAEILDNPSLNKPPKDYQICWEPFYTYRLRMWKKVSDTTADLALEDLKEDGDGNGEIRRNPRLPNSNIYSDDLVGYQLMCDRICVQNASCLELPTRFVWDDSDNLRVENRFENFDGNLDRLNVPNTDHPFYVHPNMKLEGDLSQSGLFCNGEDFVIGRHTPYDLIAIDVRVAPVLQMSASCTSSTWDGCIDAISAYRAWKKDERFLRHVHVYNDEHTPTYEEGYGIKPAWNVGEHTEGLDSMSILEGEQLKIYDDDCRLPFESFAWHFDNLYKLTGNEAYSLEARKKRSKKLKRTTGGWILAMVDIQDCGEELRGKANDNWTMTLGFTVPKPQPRPQCLLYKNGSIEVRLRAEYERIEDDNKTGFVYKEFVLDIFLIYSSRAGKRQKMCSFPIRTKFEPDYWVASDGTMNQTVVDMIDSYILIMDKSSKANRFRCWLNGEKICDTDCNIHTHMLQRNDKTGAFHVMLGHKRLGPKAEGNIIDQFAGWLYDIALYPECCNEYEANLLYRALRITQAIHVRSLWTKEHKKWKKNSSF